MMIRALDSDGDWTFGNGTGSYKTDVEALQQLITTRLKQWKGNCFFAVNDGVDWNNLLDIGTKELLDLDIKRVILQTGGVLRMTDYSSTIDLVSRSVSIQCTIGTTYGSLVYEETV